MERLRLPWSCSLCPRRPSGCVSLGHPPRKRAFPAMAELRGQVVNGAAGAPPTGGAAIPSHTVTVHDRQRGVVHQFQVPEVCASLRSIVGVGGVSDKAALWSHCAVAHLGLLVCLYQDQYILHTAEAQNITLPFACRHGIISSFYLLQGFPWLFSKQLCSRFSWR